MSANIQDKIAASVYLSRLKQQNELNADSLNKKQLKEHLPQIIDQVKHYLEQETLGEEQVSEFLKQVKAEFDFAWSCAQLNKVISFQQLGELRTTFADVTIDLALRTAWHNQNNKSLEKNLPPVNQPVPGLFILGLGKLGGIDLNFSSDIDLVAFFDEGSLPVPEMLGRGHVCNKVLQKMSQLLNQNSNINFVWRVDWRLRPEASAMPLAMASDSAEEYYFYKALPWHRLALMKGRVVAGDIEAGLTFYERIRPFIWRQNLDYTAIDEMAHLKKRINLEHPALRLERKQREPISAEAAGFNVKLGSGGIREIEFIVNGLQLVWGGKQVNLRVTNTFEAIQQLVDAKHMKPDEADKLSQAYCYLRDLENQIQMMDNGHTHIVPTEPEQQKRLLILSGLENWEELEKTVYEHRQFVNQEFEQFFNSENANKENQDVNGASDYIGWPDTLTERAQAIVNDWETGFQKYGVPVTMAEKMLPLTELLCAQVNQQNIDASEVIIKLDDFFRRLPKSTQYFRLLKESPSLLESIVPPLIHSPPMASLLKQSPHIVDYYMSPKPDEKFDSEIIFASQDYETRLERIRRFVNEHLYQSYLRFISGDIEVAEFQQYLTELAEHSLQCAMRIVQEELDYEDVPISVIGMGKLAMRFMSPLSDMDLIFVYDDRRVSMEKALNFVKRLQTALMVQMREGIVYELDTRLRPSGKSGAPTVSLESFERHHLQRAHSWEHIALVPARVILGDKKTQQSIMQVKQQVLAKHRDIKQFKNDAKKMWQRIAEHRIKDVDEKSFESKLRHGGLMQAEYLAACLAIVSATEINNISELDFVEFIELSAVKMNFPELSEILQFWRIMQLWERLLGLADKPVSDMPKQYIDVMLKHLGIRDIVELQNKIKQNSSLVLQHFESFFADVEMNDQQLDDWLETAVQWQ